MDKSDPSGKEYDQEQVLRIIKEAKKYYEECDAGMYGRFYQGAITACGAIEAKVRSLYGYTQDT